MKRFIVIGLGNFGSWAAQSLYAQGHEVIAVERRSDLVDRYADDVSRGVVGDGSDPALLEEIGAGEADAAVISTGGDLATSILATIALKDLGVGDIYVKVTSREAARALEAFGVQDTIFPEREVADRLAHHITSTTVLDYISLTDEHSIQEIAVPDAWIGKTLRELALPQEHGVQVIAVYHVLTDTMDVVPDPDDPLTESDVAVVAGRDDRVREMLEASGAED